MLTARAQDSKLCSPTLPRERDDGIYKACLLYRVDASGLGSLRKEVKHHLRMHFTSGYKVLPAPSRGQGPSASEKEDAAAGRVSTAASP